MLFVYMVFFSLWLLTNFNGPPYACRDHHYMDKMMICILACQANANGPLCDVCWEHHVVDKIGDMDYGSCIANTIEKS